MAMLTGSTRLPVVANAACGASERDRCAGHQVTSPLILKSELCSGRDVSSRPDMALMLGQS